VALLYGKAEELFRKRMYIPSFLQFRGDLNLAAISFLSFKLYSYRLNETNYRSKMQRGFQLSTSRHTDNSKGMTVSMDCPIDPQNFHAAANLTLLLVHSTAMKRVLRHRV
jgi:hypothetical protein